LTREFDAERVDTVAIGDGVTREIVLLPIASPLGFSRFRVGLELESDFSRTNDFTLSGLYTLGRLNAWGAEWRTLARVGSVNELQTEWYQPLGNGSPWFATVHAGYRGYDADLYSQQDFSLAATFRVASSAAGVAIGRRIGDAGQIQVGWQRRWLRLNPVILSPPVAEALGDDTTLSAGIPSWTANLTFDTLDSLGFPTRGYLFSLAGEYFGRDPEDQLSSSTARFDGLYAATAGAWAGHIYAAGLRSNVSLFPLTLGGFLRLSGAPIGGVIGEEVIFGRAVLARQVGSLPAAFGGAVRLGGSVEVGRTGDYRALADGTTRYAGSLFVVADTRFGPVYLAVGNTHGVGTAVYLFLGSVLLPTGLVQ
jgi:NTE family protein